MIVNKVNITLNKRMEEDFHLVNNDIFTYCKAIFTFTFRPLNAVVWYMT